QGHRGQRHRARRRDRAVPVPATARGRHRDPAGGTPDGRALMAIDLSQPAQVAAYRRRASRRHVVARVALYAFAVLASLIAAGPFIWSTITAFKTNTELYNVENNPFVFNENPTTENLDYLLNGSAFPTFLWNTVWVGLVV